MTHNDLDMTMETTSHESATFKRWCDWHPSVPPAHEHRETAPLGTDETFQRWFIGHLLRGRSWAWHSWTQVERWSSPSEPIFGHSSMGEQLMLVCETHVENNKCLPTPIRESLLVWNGKPVQNAWFPPWNDIRFFLQFSLQEAEFFLFYTKTSSGALKGGKVSGSRDGLGPGQRQQTALLLGCWHPLALKKKEATHSCILAWRIPMDRGGWWAAVHGATESDTT